MACKDIDEINDKVKKEIRSVLISSPKGMSVRQLQFDYAEFIGRQIPYREMGYLSLEQYLLAIPDACRLIGCGSSATVVPVINENVKHMNEFVIHQKTAKSNSRFRPKKRPRGIYNVKTSPVPHPKPLMSIVFPVNPNHRETIPPPHDYVLDLRRKEKEENQKSYIQPQTNINWPAQPQASGNRSSPQLQESKNWFCPQPQENKNWSCPQPQENKVANSCDNRINNSEPSTSSSSQSSPRIEEPNIESSSSYRNVEPIDSDDNDEELYFSDDDDDFDYDSSENEMDLTISVKNLFPRNQTCSELSSPRVEVSEGIDEPHVSRVSRKVKEKLQILIQEHPDGIWCSKLLRMYEQRFNQKLDPQNFGFSSVIQMCDDLPNIFHCTRPSRADWKLYDKTKPLPNSYTIQEFSQFMDTLPYSQDFQGASEPALPTNVLNSSSKSFAYPEDVLSPGETIKRQWLDDEKKPGDWVELLVSEVYDPSKFWIQLRGPTTSDLLNKLMDQMQLHYVHKAIELQLNEFSVQIGLMCAALFMNEYHRAIVIKIFDDQTIKVFYCDYGTVAQVPLRKTCLLSREFGDLPMQAVRARLANIIPKEQNTMWTRAASNLMLRLVTEKTLIGNIYSINHEREILDLIITDTNIPDVDIHINDTLVEEGHAILGTEAPLCNTSSAVVPNVHLYPAFEELESAIYPCVSDVVTMLKVGHTYETIFNGYFAPAVYDHAVDYIPHSRSASNVGQNLSRSVSVEEYTEEEVSLDYEESPVDSVPEENTEEPQCESFIDEVESTPSVEKHCEEIYDTPKKLQIQEPQPQTNRSMNPPPGFENVKPQIFDNPLMNLLARQQTVPQPVYPVNFPLNQNTLNVNQNFPIMNPSFPTNNILMLSNPLIYNQLLINQQRDAILQAVQQAKLVEDYQKMQALRQQQMQNFTQAYNLPSTSQQAHYNPKFFPNVQSHGYNSYPCTVPQSAAQNIKRETYSPNLITGQTQTNDRSFNTNSSKHVDKEHNLANDSISNKSEHICDRFVIRLRIEDDVLHILKFDGELFVVSQEIVTNLLKNDLSWKKWLQSVNLDPNSFPTKLVDLMEHDHVFNQIKRFSIPGVNPSNNLGCNVRLISLNYVPKIVEKYTNRRILSDLEAGIRHVMENQDVWKVLDPLTD